MTTGIILEDDTVYLFDKNDEVTEELLDKYPYEEGWKVIPSQMIEPSGDVEFKCLKCGQERYWGFEVLYDLYCSAHEFPVNSMEYRVIKCKSCGAVYLETELGDYDYMIYRKLVEMTDETN